MTELELNNIYKDFYLRNPNKGHKMTGKNFLDRLPGQTIDNYILFPAWFTKEEFDTLLTATQAKKYLSKLGLDIQNYYDIVVLGLSDISLRPKCVCGNSCRFRGFCVGYDKYCSREHSFKYKEVSEAFIIAGRTSRLNKKTPDEVKRKISESEKRAKAGKTYVCTPETSAKLSRALKGKPKTRSWKQHMRESALRRIKENPEKALANLKSGGFKSGKISYYTCKKAGNKTIKCLSSWEERFLRLCDYNLKYVVEVSTCEAISYVDPFTNKDRLYIPDFLVTLDTGIKVIVEIKPSVFKYDKIVLAKKKSALKFCNENNLKYITLTEKELFFKNGAFFSLFDYIY